jgi:hypothetical protein
MGQLAAFGNLTPFSLQRAAQAGERRRGVGHTLARLARGDYLVLSRCRRKCHYHTALYTLHRESLVQYYRVVTKMNLWSRARGDAIIWKENDSNYSKITM